MTDWPWILASTVTALVAAPGLLRLARARSPRKGMDFNIIDEAIHHLDTESEPWTVFIEARLPRSVDESRLRSAVDSAMTRHVMARVYQRPWRPWHTVYEWGSAANAKADLVSVIEASSPDDVARARAEFMSARVPLTSPPPFRVRLVRHPDGDHVMLNFNHAASDGVGTLRFFKSIARAYGDEADPVSEADDLSIRNLVKHSAPRAFTERWNRLSMLRRALIDAVAFPPSRIAEDGGEHATGFGCVQRKVDSETTTRLAKRKLSGGTVNDLLLGALHVAIDRWNDMHEATTKRIGTMMPVNVRPKERWMETVGNIVYFVSVSTSSAERRSLADAVSAVTRQTREVKEQGTGAALREILFASPALLLEVKRKLPQLLPLGGNRFVDTAVLSNVGRIEDPMVFGALGPATELWFNPPCRMPLGLGMGAATYNDHLFLSFRYRRALWNDKAATRFADLYESTLAEGLEAQTEAGPRRIVTSPPGKTP